MVSLRAMDSWEDVLSVLKLESHNADLAKGDFNNFEAIWRVGLATLRYNYTDIKGFRLEETSCVAARQS